MLWQQDSEVLVGTEWLAGGRDGLWRVTRGSGGGGLERLGEGVVATQ